MNMMKKQEANLHNTISPSLQTIAVVQTGGCSAVINSSLAGVIEQAQAAGTKIVGLVNAFEGLQQGRVVDLSQMSPEQLARLRATPGAFLGSSRLFITEELFRDIPRQLAALSVQALVMIGGNGTMYAAAKIRQSAQQQAIELKVIGVPKTVDNDMVGVEYTPGFGSAARFVAQAVLDIGVDLESMKTFEQVRIIEVMGRSVGWLAAAAGLAKRGEATAPHLIYLPEQAFDEAAFLEDVKRVYKKYGFVVAVIGEGIHDADGQPVGSNPFAALQAGSRIYGGAAAYLASQVNSELGLRARHQELTMAQRSFTPMRSRLDEAEAYRVGIFAVDALWAGCDGKMVGHKHGAADYYLMPLADIGGKEKSVPDEFYDKEQKQVTPAFLAWLAPMVEPWDCRYLSLADIEAIS